MVDTTADEIFAQILCAFTCKIDDTEYPVLLIQAYDEPILEFPSKDADLGFYRIRAKNRRHSEFILAEFEIRGVLTVEDYETGNDRFVVDVVDGDMFLRMQELLEKGLF